VALGFTVKRREIDCGVHHMHSMRPLCGKTCRTKVFRPACNGVVGSICVLPKR
jgi:hypothetical protein